LKPEYLLSFFETFNDFCKETQLFQLNQRMRAIKAIQLQAANFIEEAKCKMMDARSRLIFQGQFRGNNEYPSVFGMVWTI
jgi:hypothetical protein